MVMRGARRKGVALLRALRAGVRHPRNARPAAAHVPDPHVFGQQARAAQAVGSAVPAVPHRAVLGPVRRRGHAPRPTPAWSRELCQFLDGDTDPVTKRLELAMLSASDNQEYERAARLRDRLAAVNKAIAKQQIVTDDARGLRHHRHRRRRTRSGGAGVLRAPRSCRRSQGDHGRQGRGAHAGRPRRPHHRAAVLRPAAAGRAPAGAGAHACPTTSSCTQSLAVRAARRARHHSRAPARRQAGVAGNRHPQRGRRVPTRRASSGRPITTRGPRR